MITVLMAAYNGQDYIKEQIESILNQTYTDWKLIIQDDCSTDDTLNIAKEYAKQYPQKIRVFQSETNSGSAKNNFFSMLKYAKSEYVMLCDDDDIWLRDKMRMSLNRIKELEVKNGKDKPLLVHSDVAVVNKDLNVLCDSIYTYQNMNSARNKLNNLLVQNIVVGNTMMVNKALLNMIKSIPKNALMHDWWFALIACTFGEIGFVNKETVLYRQHEQNDVGAKETNKLSVNIKRKDRLKESLVNTYKQAEEFLNVYGSYLKRGDLEIVSAYAQSLSKGKIYRIFVLIKYSLWKNSISKKIGQVIYS